MQNTNKLIGRITLISCIAWLCLLLISDEVDNNDHEQHRRELMLGELSPQQERILQEDNNKSSSASSSSEAVRSSLDIDEYDIPEWLSSASDMTIAIRQQQQSTSTKRSFIPPQFLSTVQYNLQDAIESTSSFMNTVGILIYRPDEDDFVLLYNERFHRWVSACSKLSISFTNFIVMLRQEFPERFRGKMSDELAIVMSSGDYPKLSRQCFKSFPHSSKSCQVQDTPILHFGSVFRRQESLPNMIAMPMPAHHLPCFRSWSTRGSICGAWQSKNPDSGRGNLVFGEEYGLTYQDLIPQVVWRGNDFGYLGHINRRLHRPYPKQDIEDKIDPELLQYPQEKKAAATKALLQVYDNLIPRWKGVVLTAEAEVEAHANAAPIRPENFGNGKKNGLPWANVKFTGTIGPEQSRLDELDTYISAKGERMNAEELAQYKYHIDIGGGGGTTWTGTMTKMAMPGLLFHHVTPTKDYIHDYMKPWIHYVPIKADLSDLREKYEWAESHPEAAEMIASQGSDLMRHLGTPQGFGEMYQDVFVDQVRQVIEAYQPVKTTQPRTDWKEVLESYDNGFRIKKQENSDGDVSTEAPAVATKLS